MKTASVEDANRPRSTMPPQWQTTSELPRCDLTTRELATHEKTR